MVEVNGAYSNSRCEKIWSNSLRVMSNMKLFAMHNGRIDSQLAGWTNMTHYIDPYDTRMDQKHILCNFYLILSMYISLEIQ